VWCSENGRHGGADRWRRPADSQGLGHTGRFRKVALLVRGWRSFQVSSVSSPQARLRRRRDPFATSRTEKGPK
jgi:hypothetical protein